METFKELADKVKACIRGEGKTLYIVSVGDDPASRAYVKGKMKDAAEVGIKTKHFGYPATVTQPWLFNEITNLAHNDVPDGIIVQLPLPPHIDADEIMNAIPRHMDVDGLKPDSPFTPCTARAISTWIYRNADPQGKHVLIINRSKLVGRPLVNMLLDYDMTVTVAHSKTVEEDLQVLLKKADIVVSAIGKPHIIKTSDMRPTCIAIDVGISKVDGKLVGDILQDAPIKYVSPVPGGVGLLTRAMLMDNVYHS